MTKLSQLNGKNLKWAGRMMLIFLVVGVADCLVVLFARKPLPWVAMVPALIPVLTCSLVVIPMMMAEKTASPAAN